MSVTVKLILRESKARADGRAPIYLRITANRKSRYKSTGVTVRPKHWNANRQQVRKGHELSSALNKRLRQIRLEAEHAALDANTAAAVKNELEGGRGTLTKFFKGYIEGLRRRDQYWERKKYSTTLNKLQEAFGREEIDWDDLDRDGLDRFQQYCREQRENNPNTTRKELGRIRRVIRQAVKDGILATGDNPFLAYDMPKRVPPNRRRLTREEIRSLEAVSFEGVSQLRLARDAFILSFYGGGIRFGDLCTLRPDDIQDGRLNYRMMKTAKPVDLPLPPPALKMVRKYKSGDDGPFLLPLLEKGDDDDPVRLRRRIATQNALANKNIKMVAKRAKINNPDDISMHVARHSFADFARKHSDDLYAVSKALGHSSLTITENYLSDFDRDATDRLADELWTDED